MKSEIFTTSSPQTKRAGKLLAEEILKSTSGKRAVVLGLVGDLGGGKTTFLQGFAQGLGIKQRVLSPTFIVMRRLGNFFHLDCYRIQKAKELLNLDFKKIVSNPKNIVAVEWADRVRKVMPKNTTWINFEFVNKNERKITINSH